MQCRIPTSQHLEPLGDKGTTNYTRGKVDDGVPTKTWKTYSRRTRSSCVGD